MHRPGLAGRVATVALIVFAAFVVGYPASFIAAHGLDPHAWPNVSGTPNAWFSLDGLGVAERTSAFIRRALATYVNMLLGRSDGLPDGGRWSFLALCGAAAGASAIALLSGRLEPLRHPSKRFGDARFATPRELADMRQGLEIGLNSKTGSAVRIQVEGNLVTVAPPRTGKTTGLILPNLTLPEPGAWAGPSVVIDPKGDVVRAVRRRREALGRTVRCLDPVGIAGGTDRWNPLLRRDPKDVLYLQSMARALLPDRIQTSDASEFFKDRAVAVVVAALDVSISAGRANVTEAAWLVRSPDALRRALIARKDSVARDALAILNSPDDRSRGAILTTAAQVFSWAVDERMQGVVTDHTFELSDLCRGDTDLFIVLPADSRRTIIAPYVRWLLADLFSVVRETRPSERIVCFVDEAAVLGSFDAILRGVGELPGYGVSLWTFWQTRSQIEELYERGGADTIIGTAEAVMLFNLSMAQGEERQRWSDALGTYTTTDPGPSPQKPGEVTSHPVAAPLVPASDLADLTRNDALVFLNSPNYTTHPLRLRKTLAHRDRRFKGLVDTVPPIGPTRTRNT